MVTSDDQGPRTRARVRLLRHRARDDLPELAFLASGSIAATPATWSTCALRRRSAPTSAASCPAARSVIVTAHALQHRTAPYSTESRGPRPRAIARYAWGDDYHDVIRARLDALLAWMRGGDRRAVRRARRTSTPARCRSASTRSTRASAGSARTPASSTRARARGCFSAEIICSLPLEPDAPALDQCGTCTLCLDGLSDRRARRARACSMRRGAFRT